MKKMMKTALLSTALIASLGFSTNALASENGSAFEVEPYGVDINGYEYIHSTGTKNKEVKWSHLHTNPSGVTAAVTHTVSRTKHASATVSASSSFNIMQQKVGVSAEVAVGTSTSTSTSVTWNVPASSTYLLRYGSLYAQANGKENYWSNGKLISYKYVTGKWTYQGFSDSIKQ